MKHIFTIILSLFITTLSFSQDIRFSYEAVANGDNTSTVTFSIENIGASAENFATFTINFYYDDNETTVQTVDFAPISSTWNWGTANELVINHQPVNNPNVPITHTGYFVYSNFDNNFAGTEINAGESVVIGTVIFENSDNKQNDGGEAFIATIAEQPNHTYSGIDFTEHDVLSIGTQQQILPIVIRSFTATPSDRDTKLDWITSSETNGSHFEIERSNDGSTWEYLARVEAVGNSTVDVAYDYLDTELPIMKRSNMETFYYRLKMVDLDGTYEYSEIRSVEFENNFTESLYVYPNPAVQDVYVNMTTDVPGVETANLTVINRNGQIVKNEKIATNAEAAVDVSQMVPGTYYFTVKVNNEVYSQKVIVID